MRIDKNNKNNTVILYLIICSILAGGSLRIGFVSLYHIVIMASLVRLIIKKHTRLFSLIAPNNPIVCFMLIWLARALISVIWAPDIRLALKYVYCIFLITALVILFTNLITPENKKHIVKFMVVLLSVLNLIGLWEITTGNHLMRDYLGTPSRLRLLANVPGGFFANPNDFATYLILIIPFSMTAISVGTRPVRYISAFNLAAAAVVIAGTQSRTQIILITVMYIVFLLILLKSAKRTAAGLIAAVLFIYNSSRFGSIVAGAFDSVQFSAVTNSFVSGGSMAARLNLLKNGAHILEDTLGFGCGAGCHRVIMSAYADAYYDTYGILVMHNFPAELFVDYGWVVGLIFAASILMTVIMLRHTAGHAEDRHIRRESVILILSVCVFVISTVSSSSIVQLTSLWTLTAYTAAFIKINGPAYSNKPNGLTELNGMNHE